MTKQLDHVKSNNSLQGRSKFWKKVEQTEYLKIQLVKKSKSYKYIGKDIIFADLHKILTCKNNKTDDKPLQQGNSREETGKLEMPGNPIAQT